MEFLMVWKRCISNAKQLLTCVIVIVLLISRTAGAADAPLADAPLADAAEEKNASTIAKLLEQKANINAPQADGMTPLLWAVYHDDLVLTKRFVTAGADVKVANRYGVTPLVLACTNGNTAIVELLLDSGADANTTLPGGETVLMTASRTGRPGPVKVLLARKANVNARERKGQTALMWAAADGHLEVVDVLLKAEADFRTPLASGFTPLFFAIREGRSEVVFRLLDAGINVNDRMQPERRNGVASGKSTNSLILAIENGHFELALALLNAGANPDDRPAGYAALHAITWVRKPIRGDGDPPPIGSGSLSSLDIVRQLVAHKADVNIRLEKGDSGRGRFTTTGSTPFLMAARTGDVPLMRLLLELHADPQLTNADNSPPLLAAAGVDALGDGDEAAATEEEAIEAVKLLLDNGADINAVDKNGETAMHGAAYQSLPKLVQVLADRRADINIWNRPNKSNWTPLMIAQGHRPGNFRPAPETIAAIEKVIQTAGSTSTSKARPDENNYSKFASAWTSGSLNFICVPNVGVSGTTATGNPAAGFP
jgi:ankyrin repeat protein